MKFVKTTPVLTTLAFSLAIASPAAAGYSSQGTIANVLVNLNGVVTFESSAGHTSPPSCQSTTLPARWAFDATSPAGQAKLATLLTAYSLHKQVIIGGTSACADVTDLESLQFLQTVDA